MVKTSNARAKRGRVFSKSQIYCASIQPNGKAIIRATKAYPKELNKASHAEGNELVEVNAYSQPSVLQL